MGRFRKGLLVVAGILAFLAMSASFTGLLLQNLHRPQKQTLQADVYPRAVTHPTEETLPETQPVPTTLPPETEPPETQPPETQPRFRYESVPLFYMTDYPDILYRSGTLATSGSNVASLAMVASYLTGNEYRPDELADYFADYIGNSMQWLEYASDQLQLPWKKAVDFREARKALEEGKVVITLLGQKSIFTQSQHFVVLTGLNDANRITVNDPFRDHYTQWNLERGLAEGFEDVSIITGYHGSWIYDPAAMPEEPFVYTPKENTDPFRYPGIELTQEDRDLMAKLICMEAASEPFEGQQAIAEVILNRVAAGTFQSTVNSVIHAQGQFASVDRLYLAQPTHIQYEAIERALNGPYVLPIDVYYFGAYRSMDNAWGTIGNHTFCYQ
ncbi:MAG: cell wall hydrolase [Oscillospiraceae bacterium]|nr:cell wall hydrolase [Oscillospiraceae bacterium]